MISFDGNSILLVESDKAYAVQLKEGLTRRGAMVTLSHSIAEAKVYLGQSDFDLLVTGHQFSDGPVRELVEWCKDSLSNVPTFSAMGNCSQLERRQLEKLGVQSFLLRGHSEEIFQSISKALFNIHDFKKKYLESTLEKGINYELRVGNKRISVKALEITDQGIFLSFESPFRLGLSGRLELVCSEEIHMDSFHVEGILQGQSSEGIFFKISDQDKVRWVEFLSQLNRKQDEVSEFLRKASGK